MKRAVATMFLLAALLLPESLFANRAATEKRGFNASGAFQAGSVDSISLYTGALSAKVPLGQEYPLGPGFSYQLKLVYNSNGGWETDEPTFCPEGTILPEHDGANNSGFGWRLSFGTVGPQPLFPAFWFYEDPSGARHGLYGELHPGSSQPGVFFSNDSTALRMRRYAGGGPCESPPAATAECITVESPDGLTRELRKIRSSDEMYRATRIRDAFGHAVSITYNASDWTVTDTAGRAHTIEFAGPANEYRRFKKVTLTAFGGASAVYTAAYESKTVERKRFNPAGCSLDDDVFVDVFVLDRLLRPDDSYWEFDYTSSNAAPDFNPGALKTLRLPTGAEISYSYEVRSYQSQDPGGDRFDRDVNTVFPVVSKTIRLSSGGAVHGSWTYEYTRASDSVPGEILPCHRETTVTDPEGNQSVHYFSTTNSASLLWAYGLPFTYCAPGVGFDATPPFLSSEVYDGSRETGTKIRSTYVEYTSDGNFMGNSQVNQEKNHRLVHQRVVDHTEDDDLVSETRWSDFDGITHHRTVETSGNFTAQDARTVTTDYLPAGTLVVDPATGDTAGSTFVLPPLAAPWIFGTYTEQRVTAAGDTAVTEACFNQQGFRERTRLLADASRQNRDFLRVFEPERVGGTSTGRVATEKFYGGDNQSSMDNVYATLCDMTLPAGDPEYQTEHTYAAGVLESTVAVDPCDGQPVLTLVDGTIDAGTGLTATVRDAAGVETDLTYDTLGRLTSERPTAPDAWMSFDYQVPTQASPGLVVHVTQRACPNGSTGCSTGASLFWRRFEYDGLGRLTTERVRLPAVTGIAQHSRTTTYNALGWRLTESVWGDSALVTSFTAYDPYGRPGTITPPGQRATHFTYEGDRTVTRESQVMTAGGSQESAFNTEVRDVHGRLVRVCEGQAEPGDGTCTGVETTYLFDVGSRLTRVCSDKAGPVCGQIRRFLYDNRGVLTQERHPEIGVTEGASFPARRSPTRTDSWK